jgi:uncharacterized membrane protein YadS
MDKKKPWLSKTVWVNLIGALLALVYPPAGEWIAAHPEVTMGLFAGLNVILRLVSKDKISLLD